MSKRSRASSDAGSGSSSDASSDSSEEFVFQPLSLTRARRDRAGNKMHELVQQALEKDAAKAAAAKPEGEDDVYKEFVDVENDQDFEIDQQAHSDSEVDSDFDDSEVDDEPEDAGEKEVQKETRAPVAADKYKKQRTRMLKELSKTQIVPENAVDAKTQERYLKEAALVAKKNREDLVRIESEMERVRNETLTSYGPKVREQKEGMVVIKHYYDEEGRPCRSLMTPEMPKPLVPSQHWLDCQKKLPPKPEGFDDLPYERV
uniref:YL1 domain-containing protein n=1 Tax=Panagrellus redivivus TaxID=6233 RepID=A0A7E4URL4_PANRE